MRGNMFFFSAPERPLLCSIAPTPFAGEGGHDGPDHGPGCARLERA